jgi:hypothetical protein
MKKAEKIEKGIKALRRGGIWYDPMCFPNLGSRRTDKDKHSHQGGSDMKKTTKEIKKDKKFWADPMCYPVFATQR